MIAKTLAINQQTCNGQTTTPKGRTRRTVPMTEALFEALRRMPTIREGLVVRNLDGTDPWRLQTWMGHKRIDETMLYVHVAEAHAREFPECVQEAALGEANPDARIVKMLGARDNAVAKAVIASRESAA